jgi:hypothetical protein
MSREHTPEEIRTAFLGHISMLVDYWTDQVGPKSDREKLDGLAFSILSMLDGCACSLPAFEVLPAPHPDDKSFHRNEGENWWPDPPDLGDASTVHGGTMLHELWHDFRRKRGQPAAPGAGLAAKDSGENR